MNSKNISTITACTSSGWINNQGVNEMSLTFGGWDNGRGNEVNKLIHYCYVEGEEWYPSCCYELGGELKFKFYAAGDWATSIVDYCPLCGYKAKNKFFVNTKLTAKKREEALSLNLDMNRVKKGKGYKEKFWRKRGDK